MPKRALPQHQLHSVLQLASVDIASPTTELMLARPRNGTCSLRQAAAQHSHFAPHSLCSRSVRLSPCCAAGIRSSHPCSAAAPGRFKAHPAAVPAASVSEAVGVHSSASVPCTAHGSPRCCACFQGREGPPGLCSQGPRKAVGRSATECPPPPDGGRQAQAAGPHEAWGDSRALREDGH